WRRCRTTPITPRPTTSPPPRPWPGPTSVTTAPPTAPRPTAPQTTSAPPTPRPVTTTRTSSSTRRPRPSDARAAATRPCRRGRTSSSGSAARTTDPHHGHSRRDVLVPGHGRPVRPHPRRQPVGSGLRAPAALATVPHRHGGLTRRLPAQPLGVRRGRRDLRGLVPRRDRGADPRGRCRLALHDRGTLPPPRRHPDGVGLRARPGDGGERLRPLGGRAARPRVRGGGRQDRRGRGHAPAVREALLVRR